MSFFEEFLRRPRRIIHSPYRPYVSRRPVLAPRSLCCALMLMGFLGTPIPTSAAVVVSEIAWMGTANSANDEWIELYNTGSTPVSIDGWFLTDGVNLEIPLAGSIGAGAYVVLERTDEASAPGTAFLIYTGALSNAGSTLTVKRGDGAIEDQVAGGENWENIGGDNATKDTPQYSGNGWATGTPTPGTQPVAISTESEPETAEVSEAPEPRDGGGKRKTEKKETVTLTLPDPELTLSVELPSIAYVNQPLSFAVKPDGISDRLLASVDMVWNFGDAHTATGREVVHAYAYPGEYVVSILGSFARHETLARHTITILPVTVSLTVTAMGDIRVHNTARYELDLSGYVLRGRTAFTFPEHTFLLPQATLTVPASLVGASKTPVLFDQQGVVAAYRERIDEATTKPEGTVLGLRAMSQPSGSAADFMFASGDRAAEETASDTPMAFAPVLAEGDSAPAVPGDAWPYLGLIGALAVSMTALVFGRRHEDTR